MPNFAVLCSKTRSSAVKMDPPEEAGWLGQTTLGCCWRQQADPQVKRIHNWVARGHVPTALEQEQLTSSSKKMWQQRERLAMRDGVLLQRLQLASQQVVLPNRENMMMVWWIHKKKGHFGPLKTNDWLQ